MLKLGLLSNLEFYLDKAAMGGVGGGVKIRELVCRNSPRQAAMAMMFIYYKILL